MISVIDGHTQYFIAGAKLEGFSEDHEPVITNGSWFGCSEVPTPGGLCENTLALDTSERDSFPCFVINDLTKDPRFSDLAIVNGTLASYKWYVGVPITTTNRVNIGVLFVFGTRKLDGLSLEKRKFLHRQANNIMKSMQAQREAIERRRVTLMSKGIARFLEKTSPYTDPADDASSSSGSAMSDKALMTSNPRSNESNQVPSKEKQPQRSSEAVLDQIRITLDHAADLLRESLELSAGGVVFLDTTEGYNEAGFIDAYNDPCTDLGAEVEEVKSRQSSPDTRYDSGAGSTYQDFRAQLCSSSPRASTGRYKAAKILSTSTAEVATWDGEAHVLDGKSLQTLTNSYPKGNIWYIDANGYFSSLEQVHDYEHSRNAGLSSRSRRNSTFDIKKQEAEANMLSKVFHNARQIIFLPLWNAAAEKWYAASFVWSQSAVPVFTVENEVAYLAAFTSSVMVEISRLDAIIANRMKSDFISSISHEFRSPLHGILASADFLRESELDISQTEFVSTIQNCSRTLLDTINHVLDYSKINSFEKKDRSIHGSFSSELHQVANVALLCEETINGMISANHFTKNSVDVALGLSNGRNLRVSKINKPLRIILDFDDCDWIYKIHAGAFQRILMNIFGNSQKYTTEGFILVQLRVIPRSQEPLDDPASHLSAHIVLRIKDSGKGMSNQYMERKLYHPFAQEDKFSAGVGLGLSIVWSIVEQLGGVINVHSELGVGTDIQVTIPVEKSALSDSRLMQGDLTDALIATKNIMYDLRSRAVGKTVFLQRGHITPSENGCWDKLKKYCSEWYGFNLVESENSKTADLLIVNENLFSCPELTEHSRSQRVLVIHDGIAIARKEKKTCEFLVTAHISQPIGPYRLARTILSLLDQTLTVSPPSSRDAGTQSPPTFFLENHSSASGTGTTSRSIKDYRQSSNTSIDSQLSRSEAETPESTIYQTSTDQATKAEELISQNIPIRPKEIEAEQTTVNASPSTSSYLGPPETTPLRILAVDDNVTNLNLIHRYLQKRKDDIIFEAMNGLEAVAAVTESEEPFDVIFMDISMPVMDGFEATRNIRVWENRSSEIGGSGSDNGGEGIESRRGSVLKGKRNRAYVVAMTGLGSQRDRDEADRSGFDDFMTKPVKLPMVGRLLKKLSAEKAARAVVGLGLGLGLDLDVPKAEVDLG
ncbi:hypothetical protein ACMFMF_003733 [Clarireedia jacksonii]